MPSFCKNSINIDATKSGDMKVGSKYDLLDTPAYWNTSLLK